MAPPRTRLGCNSGTDPCRSRISSTSTAAPATARTSAKSSAPISPAATAARFSTEFAAKSHHHQRGEQGQPHDSIRAASAPDRCDTRPPAIRAADPAARIHDHEIGAQPLGDAPAVGPPHDPRRTRRDQRPRGGPSVALAQFHRGTGQRRVVVIRDQRIDETRRNQLLCRNLAAVRPAAHHVGRAHDHRFTRCFRGLGGGAGFGKLADIGPECPKLGPILRGVVVMAAHAHATGR